MTKSFHRMTFYVYILCNKQMETYVGQTINLTCRLREHNDLEYYGTLHTKRHSGPWTILHYEKFTNRSQAMQREKELKTGKGRDFIKTLLRDKSSLDLPTI